MNLEENKQTNMTLNKALVGFMVPLGVILTLVLTGHDIFIALFVAMVTLVAIGLIFGYKFDFLQNAIMSGGSSVLGAVLIMLMVGILIGVWMSCGSVPAMLYYGLKIIHPKLFLPISFIICVITSMATGTSWGTAGTMGVALMGVAAGIGVPLPLAAGCIVSGAHVGDKLSPLSDTTLLASASTGTKLFDHIVSMLYTTIPGSLICLIAYTIIGWGYGDALLQQNYLSDIETLTSGLAATFNINLLMLIPPLLVIVL
jgi:NhaC family Na+:H+ antiporter